MRQENHALLKAAGEWYDTSFCTSIPTYQQRIKQLMDSFGDLYTTDLLNVHKYGTTGTKSQKQQSNGEEVAEDPLGDASSVSSMSHISLQESV
jgi:hypothetical protein